MSTLSEVVDSGAIAPFKANLRSNQLPCRMLYISETAMGWAKRVLPTATAAPFTGAPATPLQQLDTLTRRYCAGEDFRPPLPHPMNPEKDGIWRLRTTDLRIVGWFLKRCVFIISEIELKSNCTTMRDNELMETARQLRATLNIDGGIYLEGHLDECI